MIEKLVELQKEAGEYLNNICIGHSCDQCPYDRNGIDCDEYVKAEYLIDHGVTVQEWISVKDRLPENDYGKHWKERPHYLVCLANGLMRVATFGFKEYGWWIDSHSCVLKKEHYTEVTHWMPLPQPPKGE